MANRGKRILIVEDDADTRALLRAWLAAEGHEVIEASTGERGSRMLAEDGSYDLVTVDVRLPGIDGFEVVRRARAGLAKETPMLLVTVTDPEDLSDDLEVVDHLSKPFTKSGLLEAVGRALG